MKTVIISKTEKVLEIAKETLYSLQVLAVGLFISFLFLFGITYNTPKATKSTEEMNASNPRQAGTDKITVDFTKVLSDQNS